jgi:hypothetical protein
VRRLGLTTRRGEWPWMHWCEVERRSVPSMELRPAKPSRVSNTAGDARRWSSTERACRSQLRHHPAVTGNIGGEDRGEFAFDGADDGLLLIRVQPIAQSSRELQIVQTKVGPAVRRPARSPSRRNVARGWWSLLWWVTCRHGTPCALVPRGVARCRSGKTPHPGTCRAQRPRWGRKSWWCRH